MKSKCIKIAVNSILFNIFYIIIVKANNVVTQIPAQVTNSTTIVALKQTLDNSTCEANEDCGHVSDDENILCVNKKCRCGPDYHYNVTTRTCELFECKSHPDCTEYDDNRRCDPIKGKCICKNIFMEAPFTKLCFPKISGPCNKSADCSLGGEQNVICANNHCRCKVNFKYARSQNQCAKFNCANSLECREYDQNRKCSVDHKCVCENNLIEDQETFLCIPDTQTNKPPSAQPVPVPVPGQPQTNPAHAVPQPPLQPVGATPTIKPVVG